MQRDAFHVQKSFGLLDPLEDGLARSNLFFYQELVRPVGTLCQGGKILLAVDCR